MAIESINGTTIALVQPKQLHSNGFFDRVEIQTKKRPEFFDDSGNYELDSVKSGQVDVAKSILPQSPNSYKDNGVPVENLGYFIIPRSIANDPRYQAARLKYQKVLFTILKHAAFAPTTHSIGIEVIPIAIGQFCVTERRLVDLCNEGVKFKDDFIDRNIVTRAVQFFCKCQYLIQQVIHGKTLITVTIPDFYKAEKPQGEPESDPKVSQNRASKEEEKEEKEDKSSLLVEVAVAPSKERKVSSSRKRKKVEPAPLVERDKGVFTSDIAHEKLIQEKGSEQVVKEIYSAMAVWKAQNGIQGGDDYRTAIKWSITPKNRPRTYAKPAQPKYNHDTSPSHPSKSISFAEEV